MKKHLKIICCYLLIISNLNTILGQKIETQKLKIGDINETSLSISWKNETNTKHIIIAKKGSPITAKPIDGVDYFESNIFGLGNELADDEFIVYEGNDDRMNLVGLSPNTVYHFAMFEYNGSSYFVDYEKNKFSIGNTKTKKAAEETSANLESLNIDKSTNNLTVQDGEKLGIKIFGNPVQDILRFEFSSNDEFPFEAKFYNQSGHELISQKCNPNTKIEIDMIHFPSGLYVLVVNDGYRFYNTKILKIN